MTDTWTCPHHNIVLPKTLDGWCPVCLEEMQRAPDPETMTGAERRAEMERWEFVTVPFEMIHARYEALVGRAVFMHELGLCWNALLDEAESDERGTPLALEQLIEPLREIGKDVIVFSKDDEVPS